MIIHLPKACTAAIENAARELHAYAERLGVAEDLPACTLAVCGALAPDALRITVSPDGVLLEGGNDRGVLYAVYRLLEQLGCRFYAEDTEVLPALTPAQLTALLPEGLTISEASPFEFRDLYWIGTYSPAFAVKRRLNAGFYGTHPRRLTAEWGGGIGYAGPHFVHTFEHLIPAKEFFEEHPEYFSMINGERCGKHLYSQLCLSNPDVLRITVERVKEWLRANPGAKIVSVSQNDSFVMECHCTCPACAAIDAEEGSPAGTLLRFVNSVAEAIEEEFPDVAVDTLAYQYSTKPPQITRPRHNVIVRLCTGYCASHALEDCERNAFIRDCFKEWSKVCDRLYVWDYTADFAQYLAPFPNLEVLQPNARFFAAHSVKGVFEQGNYQEGLSGEFGELRSFMLSSLLWDPDQAPDVEGFLAAYYGGGAPFVKQYLQIMREKFARSDASYVFASSVHWNPLVSDEEIALLDELWENAHRAALAGGVTADGCGISPALAAEHVERSALCHRWMKLDCKRGEFADEATFAALEQRFHADCRRLGVLRLAEGANVPWIEADERA